MDHRRKQIIYRANHRGIKEMDMLLGGFASEKLNDLSDADLDRFEALMEHSDRDLLKWFTNEEPAPQSIKGDLFDAILELQRVKAQKASSA